MLLGFGNVAQALLPLLASRDEWVGRELGVRPMICGIGTRHHGFFLHPDGFDLHTLAQEPAPQQWFNERSEQVQDAEMFISAGKGMGATLLLELTTLNPADGQPALTHVRNALQAGLHVITANKGPIAFALTELQALARRRGVQLRFEATVLDGLPLFNLAQSSLQAAEIHAFRALLNSTSTLILSLIEQGYPLDAAIQQAQQAGVAEADPTYDLDGWDAVMKTTILANTLLEGQLTPHQIRRASIRQLALDDIRAAARQGMPIRLVSQARRIEGRVIAEVGPQHIAAHDILRCGQGTTSVITLETAAMGTISLVEHEPTTLQTAYGVFNDLIAIVQQQRRAVL